MYQSTLGRVYASLREFQRENRYSPTINELARMTGFCKQTILDALDGLANQRAIVRKRRVPRGSYIPTEPSQYDTAQLSRHRQWPAPSG